MHQVPAWDMIRTMIQYTAKGIDPMTVPLDMARKVLESQPFSQLLGAELTRFDDIAELQLRLKPEFHQQHGFAHGGVLSYLADNALTFAGGLALGDQILTSEYTIHYLKPARGGLLIARAEVVSAGRSQCVCRCDVFSRQEDEETLCATALGTIVAIRK
jgi:uncharacterized protein (TIGR00369 family)